MPEEKTILLLVPQSTYRRRRIKILDLEKGQRGTTECRVHVDKKHIRYVTIGSADFEEQKHDPKLLARQLACIWPHGDWDKAYIGENSPYELYIPEGSMWPRDDFRSLTWVGPPPGPTVNGYLERVVDIKSLVHVDNAERDLHVVTCAEFPRRPLIYKFAAFPSDEQRIQHEAAIYGVLSLNADKHNGIVPIFVAHVRINGKLNGFLLEHVSDRIASMPIYNDACRKALKQLHALGIKHGNVQYQKFLIRDDNPAQNGLSKAVIIGFGKSSLGASKTELKEELAQFRGCGSNPELKDGDGDGDNNDNDDDNADEGEDGDEDEDADEDTMEEDVE